MKLRVRFAETDQMGIAHHSSYVVWFEAARVEWLRERGMSYREMEEAGVSLAVSSVAVQYRRSAVFDDELIIDACLNEAKSRRVKYSYKIIRATDQLLIATGESVHIPTDRASRAMRLPEAWLQQLRPHLSTGCL